MASDILPSDACKRSEFYGMAVVLFKICISTENISMRKKWASGEFTPEHPSERGKRQVKPESALNHRHLRKVHHPDRCHNAGQHSSLVNTPTSWMVCSLNSTFTIINLFNITPSYILIIQLRALNGICGTFHSCHMIIRLNYEWIKLTKIQGKIKNNLFSSVNFSGCMAVCADEEVNKTSMNSDRTPHYIRSVGLRYCIFYVR